MKTTPIQLRDTCLAITLLLLIIFFFTHNMLFVSLAIIVLLLGMIIPKSMKPLAIVWFALAEALGRVVSTIILAFVFAFIVFPVAFTRQILGKDTLKLKDWKQSQESCFVTREHTYSAQDFDKTY